MFGRSTIAWTSARTSGSVVGIGPVPKRDTASSGIQALDDLEAERIQGSRHRPVVSVPGKKPVEQVQHGGSSGDLNRVDVRLEEKAQLIARRTAVKVRHRREPD